MHTINHSHTHPPSRFTMMNIVIAVGEFLGFAWIPLCTAIVWLGGIIALLAIWIAEGRPQYQPGEGSIVFISDVGAHVAPLFISI